MDKDLRQIKILPFLVTLLILIFVLGNDIRMKSSYAYTSDFEGAGVSNLILILITICATGFCLAVLIGFINVKLWLSVVLSSLIPICVFFYLTYFDFYGLIDKGNYSANPVTSKQKDFFIKKLSFSDTTVVSNKDTVKIISGWSERQHIIDHTHLIKTIDDTSTVNYTLKLSSNKSFEHADINYVVNTTEHNGSNTVDSLIRFSTPSSQKKAILTFLKISAGSTKDSVIKRIVVY